MSDRKKQANQSADPSDVNAFLSDAFKRAGIPPIGGEETVGPLDETTKAFLEQTAELVRENSKPAGKKRHAKRTR